MIYLSAFSDEAADSLQGQIEAMKRNNVYYTELRSIEKKNVKDFTLEEAESYAKTLEENGIKVWSIGSPLGKEQITLDFAKYEDTIRHVCRLANIFKTDKIRMFSFFNAYNDREKVLKYLQRMVEIGQEYGVKMYHENEKGIYGDTAERVLDIMQNVQGLFYIYDPANFLQVGEDADKTLNALHATTDYFHIKDVVSATGELVPAGYGDGKLDELVRRVDKDTTFTLEPHLRIFGAYAQIDGEEMKNKFHFESNGEAFDAAVNAIKKILVKEGYKEMKGGFVK